MSDPVRRRAAREDTRADGSSGATARAPGAARDRAHARPRPACAEPSTASPRGLPDVVGQWFEARGWTPFPFQREVWEAYAEGRSGLLHATTGAGKTHAVWFAALIEALRESGAGETASAAAQDTARRGRSRARTAEIAAGAGVGTVDGSEGGESPGGGAGFPGGARSQAPDRARATAPGPRVLWITPMRALATDTARALAEPLAELGLDWRVALRTGDTPSSERARQQRRPPQALVTTPESLSLMLAQADARERLSGVRLLVVDEWHELVGNKRGVQVQLAHSRLAAWNPALRAWALSATLGNLEQACAALLGAREAGSVLVRGQLPRTLVVDTVLPEKPERFPWAGHLGLRMVEPVAREIERSGTTLVFTNVRSQAELWYQALLEARPDWAGQIALHHGSLDRRLRDWVEAGLREGSLRAVVCTSSLDLGVDFLPVERVLQVGSPKGIARLLQRAGRSGHAPGRISRVSCVPTHSFELVEAAAARRAVEAGRVEPRHPPEAPVDVLVQHLVTVALGGGFTPEALHAEVRTTHAYRALSKDTFDWALAFVTTGGSLAAYPEYRRVQVDEDGVHRVPDRAIARRHRMSIGTIVGEAAMQVRYLRGGSLGTIEESFVSRLQPGQAFLFGGRVLALRRVRDMTAFVERAKPGSAVVPRWQGGRSPLSTELADAVVALIAEAGAGRTGDLPEMACVSRLLELQARWSVVPSADELLVETTRTREGYHLFCFPFAGRLVHTGLASLLGWRVARHDPNTFSLAVNDYGFELLSARPVDWAAAFAGDLLAPHSLREDLLASLNAGELARRRFREIARVAGLVDTGLPGAPRRARDLQASAGLLHDVFERHDPGNLLLEQARAEVLRDELEFERLSGALARMRVQRLRAVATAHPTPFAFPLLAARIRERLSTERAGDRIARMVAELERVAGDAEPLSVHAQAGDIVPAATPVRGANPAPARTPRPGRRGRAR